MDEEVDLGLSLGLRGPSQSHSNPLHSPPQLSLMPAPIAQLSEVSRSPAKSPFLCRGIDVNMALASDRRRTYEGEQDGVCSPNSSASSAVSGGGAGNDKKNGEDAHRRNSSVGDEGELERALSRGMSDEEDGGEGSRSRKLRLSKEQATVLEESFKKHHTLNPRQKLALAKQLNLRPRQVEVWFQNRRARTKLKQTEVDCELLRRCCEGLREENRRLQKEVQELRALKLLSPQHYMHMAPATTLTICPSCERLGSVPSAPNANSAATASSLAAHPPALAGAHDHPQQFPLSRLRPHVLPPSHLLSAHRRLLRSPLPMGAASPPLRERGREMGHHSR